MRASPRRSGAHPNTPAATRLRAVLRDEDLNARQGGDEFLVPVTGSDRGGELRTAIRFTVR